MPPLSELVLFGLAGMVSFLIGYFTCLYLLSSDAKSNYEAGRLHGQMETIQQENDARDEYAKYLEAYDEKIKEKIKDYQETKNEYASRNKLP